MDRTLSAPAANSQPNVPARTARRTTRFVMLILAALFSALACKVNDTRAGLPLAVQTAIDALTDDINAGRDVKVYDEAAEEWRQAATPDESRAQLERVRTTFGRVSSRALIEAREQQTASGHTFTVKFNTRFERGDAIETFTLVERAGRWLLARYAVHSDALK